MNALEIRQLVKNYPNGVQALKGIDLTVKQGDFYALLGPNGAGKSTALGIITSLIQKTSGRVKIFGYDIEKDSINAKLNVGLVPQEFNFNIFQQVEQTLVNQAGFYGVPRPLARERAEKYLKQLDLWEKRHQPGRSLSGGQKRRLMIARALMHEPPLLILDEPTAGVDIEIRRSMWELLREMNQRGVTIILTTHYLEEAENLCKNIGIIHQGKIIENTSMQEVLRKLQFETFILNFTSPLQQMPDLAPFSARLGEDASSLEVDIEKGHTLNALFALLSNQRLEVSSLRNKSNRLEELFLKIIRNE
jgi:ABC-2 type transport system ATP-binding protein